MIKTFESWLRRDPPKFKKGDVVYAINIDGTSLKKDTPYIVDIVDSDLMGDQYLITLTSGIIPTPYNESRFISKMEYDSNKFNI